jgi:hypothetical protein
MSPDTRVKRARKRAKESKESKDIHDFLEGRARTSMIF